VEFRVQSFRSDGRSEGGDEARRYTRKVVPSCFSELRGRKHILEISKHLHGLQAVSRKLWPNGECDFEDEMSMKLLV